VAAARFAAKDWTASFIFKPEYRGVSLLPIEGGLIVDVGANRGQSIAAFRRLAPRSPIVAFEPEPKSVARLRARYRHDPPVTIHGCALGECEGTVTFFVPTYGRWNCDGMPATDRATATEWLKNPGRMLYFDEALLKVSEVSVDCRTLDSFGLAPSLIKLHAQGAELSILKGAKETVLRHKPALMCAFPSAEVTKLLTGWGYRSYVFAGGRLNPGVAQPPMTFTWYLAKAHISNLPAA
jgi:FkbM family methyltransferase